MASTNGVWKTPEEELAALISSNSWHVPDPRWLRNFITNHWEKVAPLALAIKSADPYKIGFRGTIHGRVGTWERVL